MVKCWFSRLEQVAGKLLLAAACVLSPPLPSQSLVGTAPLKSLQIDPRSQEQLSCHQVQRGPITHGRKSWTGLRALRPQFPLCVQVVAGYWLTPFACPGPTMEGGAHYSVQGPGWGWGFQTSLQTRTTSAPQLPQFYHERRGPAGSVLSLEGAILEGSP